jgi:hypothetical protein
MSDAAQQNQPGGIWQQPKRMLAAFICLLLILQAGMFFIGFNVPLRRILMLWGRSREERLGIIWQPGLAFTSLAAQFPTNAQIFYVAPDPFIRGQIQYYFYPRRMSVTATNAPYDPNASTNTWERPTIEWLVSNRFTHVLTFRNGARAWEVRPDMQPIPGLVERAHGN